MSEIECSVVIVNYNSPLLITKCLESIDKHLVGISKEVIIVDNNSADQNLAQIQIQYSYVKVIYLHDNMGFGYANNVGSRNACSGTLLLLNSDTELIDSSLVEVIKQYNVSNDRSMWGIKLIWPDGRFQNSYSRKVTFFNFIVNYTAIFFLSRYFKSLNSHKYFDVEFKKITEVDVIYGTVMLIKKKYFEELEGFSKKYFMYFEDVDFCDRFKKKKNGKIFYNPQASIIHNVMGSTGKKVKLNVSFLKSKYIYGLDKFGYFLMLVFIIPDLIMEYTRVAIKKIIKPG